MDLAFWPLYLDGWQDSHLDSSFLLLLLLSSIRPCKGTNRGSCRTNLTSCVNFTLRCLTKKPGPGFSDLGLAINSPYKLFPKPPYEDPIPVRIQLHNILKSPSTGHLKLSNKSTQTQITGHLQSALFSGNAWGNRL